MDAWIKANPEKYKARMRRFAATQKRKDYRRAWATNNQMKLREQARVLRAKHPNRHRDYQLRHLYGISYDDFLGMLARQNNECQTCGISAESRRMVVDHDHATRKVRGVLCHICNSVLGLVSERISVLDNMKLYLASHCSATA
jgi:hypothetical protein